MRTAGSARVDGSIVLLQASATPTTISGGVPAQAYTLFTPSNNVAGHTHTLVHASAADATKRFRILLTAQATNTQVVLATGASTASTLTYNLPTPSPASATTEELLGASSSATLSNKTLVEPQIENLAGTQRLKLTVANSTAGVGNTLTLDPSNQLATTWKSNGNLNFGAAVTTVGAVSTGGALTTSAAFTTTGGALTLNAHASGSVLTFASTGTLTLSYTSGDTLTVPAGGGTVVLTTGAQSITGQKTFTAPQILAGSTLDTDTSGTLTIGGVNATTITLGRTGQQVTMPGSLVITQNLTVNGTTTSISTTNLEVSDKNITVNFGGNDASAEGAGLTVDRTSTDGSLVFDSTLVSKWKLGLLGAESEVLTAAGAQTLTGVKTFSASPVISTITNTGTLTLPTTTDTLVGRATTDNLSNKTIAFTSANDAATGSNATLTAPTTGIVRLTNAGLVSVEGISATAVTSGRALVIENKTGVSVIVFNAQGTAANQIFTGTGAQITLGNNASLFLVYDSTSTKWQVIGGAGGGSYTQTAEKTTTYTAVTGDEIPVNATVSFTITLPTSPSAGNRVRIFDPYFTLSSAVVVTIDRNGQSINNQALNIELDSPGAAVELVFTPVVGWRLFDLGSV